LDFAIAGAVVDVDPDAGWVVVTVVEADPDDGVMARTIKNVARTKTTTMTSTTGSEGW